VPVVSDPGINAFVNAAFIRHLIGTCKAILAIQERKSRLLLMTRQPSKAALPAIEQLIAWLRPLGEDLCKTLTFDNGTEFALHYQLNALGIATFFCDTHSRGRRAGSKTRLDAYADRCPERPISQLWTPIRPSGSRISTVSASPRWM
jgi:hypothetical protein